MLGKTPISMLLLVWITGIILFFNFFLAPYTKQLEAINDISMESKYIRQNYEAEENLVYDSTENYIEYTPLAIFDKFFK